MKQAWSIRAQLLAWLIPMLVGVRLVSGVVVLQLTKGAITRAYDSSLENSASAIAAQAIATEHGVVFTMPKMADKMLRSSEQDSLFYQVFGPNGEPLGGNAVLPRSANSQTGNNRTKNASAFEKIEWNGLSLRQLTRSYYIDPDKPASKKITVLVAETMEQRSQATSESVYHILIQQIVAMIAVVAATWYGVGRSMKPVKKIQHEIEQRSGYDFRPVEADPAPSELRPLIKTINSLLLRVGADVEAQRRFASNAAHQLRTPLAGVRAHAEVAKQAVTLQDARESIDQLMDGTDRCTHLIRQLLAISRVEPGARDNVVFSPLDLGEIAKDCCKLQLGAAIKKYIDLGYEGPEMPIMIFGNRTCIQEMLMNLVDNAIRYSPTFSTVTIRLISSDSGPILTVEDNGTGIPTAERQKVFERFYRLLGTGEEGSGLGLAIVKEVANLHGASVSLDSLSEGSGLVVNISFPKVTTTKTSESKKNPQGFSA